MPVLLPSPRRVRATLAAAVCLTIAVATACHDPLVAPAATTPAPRAVDRMRATIDAGAALGSAPDVQLVFEHPTAHEYAWWRVSGGAIVATGSFGGVPSAWSLVGAGDLNADGIDDLAWQHATGPLVRWSMTTGDAVGVSTALPVNAPPPWRLAGAADFDGDGTADLVWHHPTSGEVVVWRLGAGGALSASTSLGGAPTAWRVAAVGDLSGDGIPDLLWENATTGARGVWVMTDRALSGHTFVDLGVVPTNWTIAAVADADGDGQADIFWQDPTTGSMLVWLMNGTSYRSTISPGSPPAPWRLRAVRRSGTVVGGQTITPMVSVGGDETCALSAAGRLACWGTGYLGDGTYRFSPSPIVIAPEQRFSTVNVGTGGACALTTVGEAYCWGTGLIGTSVTDDAPRPTAVPTALRFRHIAVGQRYACGLDAVGQVSCWGWNLDGVFGNGTTSMLWTSTPAPVQQGGVRFASISAASNRVCAIATDGRGYCWGANYGAIGDGTLTGRLVPTPIAGGLTFSTLSTVSLQTCGVTTVGAAYCWGADYGYALGVGSVDDPNVTRPKPVIGGVAFDRVVVGSDSKVCGLTPAGRAYCWGEPDAARLALDPSPNVQPIPVATSVTFARGSLTTNWGTVCGISTSDQVYCWGEASQGQLGNGVIPYVTVPTLASVAPTLTAVAAGSGFTCGLSVNGEALCWGESDGGQLGRDTPPSVFSTTPTPVAGGHRFTSIAASGANACALDAAGQAYCWGASIVPGNGTTQSSRVPVAVDMPEPFIRITMGPYLKCALAATGAAYCWGEEADRGTVGFPNGYRARPAAVVGELRFSVIAPTPNGACAVSLTGVVYCWGRDIGIDGTIDHSFLTGAATPTAPGGQTGHRFVDVGVTMGEGICALDDAGRLYCWLPGASVPTEFTTAHLTRLVGDGMMLCGFDAVGAAWCAGSNYSGELGNGSLSPSYFPTTVAGGLSFADLAIGGDSYGHTCGVTRGGQTYCWGSNRMGELGTGTAANATTPMLVPNAFAGSAIRLAPIAATLPRATGPAAHFPEIAPR